MRIFSSKTIGLANPIANMTAWFAKRQSSAGPARRTFRRRARLGEAGFSLIEILVVITIIGLIMGLVGPRVLNYLGESKVKAAKIQLESFSSALDLFYLDVGRYPASNEGLAALARAPAGVANWNGPYVRGGTIPNDPWGNPYVYRAPGERAPYEIVSYGSDGQTGGSGSAADLVSGQR